jgi:hypothetical protein
MHYAWIKRSRHVRSKGRVPLFLVFEQNLNPSASSGALKIHQKNGLKLRKLQPSQSGGV